MFKNTLYLYSSVPQRWFIPRGDRALLAGIGLLFWLGTLWQAIAHSTENASVFSFFGLGLLYLLFSLGNLAGGVRIALDRHKNGEIAETHPRSLIELFVVLAGMAIFNAVLLLIYLAKDVPFTQVDGISIGIDILILITLFGVYGRDCFLHPIARGWMAIAGKTVPQFVLAGLFIAQPQTASGLALITLAGINALSTLRFIPTLKGYLRDPSNKHLRGLLLGEAGNVISAFILTLCWGIAHLR